MKSIWIIRSTNEIIINYTIIIMYNNLEYLLCTKHCFWGRKLQPTPVFLPGESHGWRSLVGYSPWGRTESDTTEAT